MATVEAVSTTMERMQATGEMKEINRAFKAARLDNPSLRCSDYLQGRKARMLEAIARQVMSVCFASCLRSVAYCFRPAVRICRLGR